MATVVMILMLIVCFNFILKQTFHKPISVVLTAVAAALFTGLMWQFAIEQSKTQIADWLSNRPLMLDTSVLLCLEVAIQISFCMLATHIQTTITIKRRTLWTYRLLRWFPGVLIFPVLFSELVALIFYLPGISFSLIAWCFAACVALLTGAGSWLMKWILPEKELRLELLFLSNALLAILGIVTTVNGTTAAAGLNETDWGALTGVIGLVIAGIGTGIFMQKLKKT